MAGVLYKKEREVLEFLAQFQHQYGYSPTLGEIAKATGHRSNATIHAIIRSLVEKGYVQKVEGNARVLKIIDQKVASTMTGNQPSLEIPMMGYIEQEKSLEPHADPNATIQVSSSLISGQRTAFALQVRGYSFRNEAIIDGDILVIERISQANEGDVIVATLEGQGATIKRYTKLDGSAGLEPILEKTEPLHITSFTLIGKVVALVRKY